MTYDELQILINKEFSIPRLQQIKDVFVFCSFTGLAYSDALDLKDEHFIKDNEGQTWIYKDRVKTGVICNIPLLSIPADILKKYANDPYWKANVNYEFSKTDEQFSHFTNDRRIR